MSMWEGKGRHGGWLNHLEGPAIIEGHIMKKVLFLHYSAYQGQKLRGAINVSLHGIKSYMG